MNVLFWLSTCVKTPGKFARRARHTDKPCLRLITTWGRVNKFGQTRSNQC